MNAVIEQKLKELLEESLEQSAPAAHAVVHLLYACYLNGNQNEFAKWCCQFSPGLKMQAGIDSSQHLMAGEFTSEPKDWIC